MSRDEIVSYCDDRLDAALYSDIAINGLQVEGSPDIQRLAIAVSASDRTISAAADWRADALLVHHGLFWGGTVRALTGLFGQRVRKLFQADINLIGYHLPLDGDKKLGNNVLLARQLGLRNASRFAEIGGMPLGVIGEPEELVTLSQLLNVIESALDRRPVSVGPESPTEAIHRVGVVSGSGYGTLAEAASLGCQAVITGDVREPTMAEARELGIVAIAAGHEATERTGVQELGNALGEHFGIETTYLPDPNPI